MKKTMFDNRKTILYYENMEQMPTSQPEPTVYQSPLPKKKLIIIGGLILLIIILFSLYYFKIINFKTTSTPAPISQTPPERTIKESESPVAFSVLQNPIIYEWRGSVIGKLTAKDKNSITLTDDKGQSITMQTDKGTKFFQPIKEPIQRKPDAYDINIDEIPIGTYLSGEFWVFNNAKNVMKAGAFNIIKK